MYHAYARARRVCETFGSNLLWSMAVPGFFHDCMGVKNLGKSAVTMSELLSMVLQSNWA
jgi:hypothetical protein